MDRKNRDRMDTVCNVCGDVGVAKELVTCNRCKKVFEHTYCMNERPFEVPLLWYCEECLQYCRGVQERMGACKKLKIFYGDDSLVKSSEGLDKRSLGDEKNQAKDFKTQEMKDPGVAVCSQTLHMPLPLIRNPVEKLSSSHYSPQACWEGTLKILDMDYHEYQGIQAHLPCVFCPKIVKLLKELPKTVPLKVSTRKDLWPKIFQADPPTKEDIGLYFFPCEQGRPKEKYFCLLDQLDAQDFSLWTCIKDVKLLIFSSNQLPQGSRRIGAESYMWGVFCRPRCKKVRMHAKLKSLSISTATRPLTAGHKENDVPISSNMSAPGLTSPNSNDFKCARSSFNKSPSNKLAGIRDPDLPPGFSEIRPPRYSKSAGSKLNVQLDMEFEDMDMGSDLPVPCIDIQAPDLSKAQSREINPMKSANPIDQNVPPGFSNILPPGFSEPPRSKHQDSSCEAMISDPTLSRTDDKNNVKVTIPVDPDVPPGFAKISQSVRSKYWHNSCEAAMPSVIVEYHSEKVAKHQDSSCEAMISDPTLSRTDDKNNVKVTIPVDPDVPPGFAKISQSVRSKYWHNSCEAAMPSVIEYHSEKVANSIDSDAPRGFSRLSFPAALKDHDVKPMCLQVCGLQKQLQEALSRERERD